MEIGLDGELIIKCLDCGAEYRIDIDSLDEECYGCDILESPRNNSKLL